MIKSYIISIIYTFTVYACVAPKLSFPTYTQSVLKLEAGFDFQNKSYQLLDIQGNGNINYDIQSKFLDDLNNLSSKPIMLVSSAESLLIQPTLELNPSSEHIKAFGTELAANYLINVHVNYLQDNLFDSEVKDGGVGLRNVEMVVQVYDVKSGLVTLDNHYQGRLSHVEDKDGEDKNKVRLDISKSLEKLSLKTYQKAWKHLKEHSVY